MQLATMVLLVLLALLDTHLPDTYSALSPLLLSVTATLNNFVTLSALACDTFEEVVTGCAFRSRGIRIIRSSSFAQIIK